MEGTVLIAVVGGLFLACLFLYGLAASRRRNLRSAVQVYTTQKNKHASIKVVLLHLKLQDTRSPYCLFKDISDQIFHRLLALISDQVDNDHLFPHYFSAIMSYHPLPHLIVQRK